MSNRWNVDTGDWFSMDTAEHYAFNEMTVPEPGCHYGVFRDFIIELVAEIENLQTAVIDLEERLDDCNGYETIESQHFRRYVNDLEERISKRTFVEPRVLMDGFDEGWTE